MLRGLELQPPSDTVLGLRHKVLNQSASNYLQILTSSSCLKTNLGLIMPTDRDLSLFFFYTTSDTQHKLKYFAAFRAVFLSL